MTQYMLLIYGDESGWAGVSEDDRDAMLKRYGEYSEWLTEKGWMRGGDALHDTTLATSVRVKDGERIVTDGPFAETKEQLGRLLPDRGRQPRRRDRGGGALPGSRRAGRWRSDRSCRRDRRS